MHVPTRQADVLRMATARASAAVVAAFLCVTTQAADLQLEITNVRSSDGSVMIAVYDDPASYLKKTFREMSVAATPPAVQVAIKDLPDGTYAVAVYHDRNGNEDLDSNALGVPKEPYGFSGKGASRMGPTDWKDARFDFGDATRRIQIRLNQ